MWLGLNNGSVGLEVKPVYERGTSIFYGVFGGDYQVRARTSDL